MPTSSRAAVAVEDRMFRALAVLRVVVLVHTVGVNAWRDNFDHPGWAWVCLAGMSVWTLAAIWLYRRPEQRGPALLVTDLALAVGFLAVTPLVKGPWFSATLTGYWVVGALLAWGVRYGWRGGLVAGVALGGVDLLVRSDVQQKDWGNVFLLLLGGTMVGFLCDSLKQMAVERDVAQREAAAAEERARLARTVHDGVLQVLALVQRRGAEIGGEASELGRLAGEQETVLRTLIRSQAAVDPADGSPDARDADLAAALGAFGLRPGVQVGLPAGRVDLPATVVAEVSGAVGACLDNVARHVGEGAPAWVLLEDLGDRVEVSVRDDGPGIPEHRLAEAEAEGRLGVAGSIRGRLADLGGSALLETGPHGTEWTLVVPR